MALQMVVLQHLTDDITQARNALVVEVLFSSHSASPAMWRLMARIQRLEQYVERVSLDCAAPSSPEQVPSSPEQVQLEANRSDLKRRLAEAVPSDEALRRHYDAAKGFGLQRERLQEQLAAAQHVLHAFENEVQARRAQLVDHRDLVRTKLDKAHAKEKEAVAAAASLRRAAGMIQGLRMRATDEGKDSESNPPDQRGSGSESPDIGAQCAEQTDIARRKAGQRLNEPLQQRSAKQART